MSQINTMEDFAKACGISRPTVSKYFHDASSVRPKTRAKIEEALERYDYSPNIYAINQNRKLTKTIGIVVPHLADPFFAEMARVIEAKLLDAGMSPAMYSAYGDPRKEVEILDGLRAMKPAGVLMAPLGEISDRRALEKFAKAVPTIVFDSRIEGFGEAFIGSDNGSFISQTVDYLVRVAAPPLFFDMATPANPNAIARRDHYVRLMDKLGVEPQIFSVSGRGWKFEEVGFRGALDLLSQGVPDRPVLCSNDRLAMGFLAAAYEKGVRVGRLPTDDLQLASNDDHPLSRYTCPPLTTAAHDYDAVAGLSVRMLLERIEQGSPLRQYKATFFQPRLALRDSA